MIGIVHVSNANFDNKDTPRWITSQVHVVQRIIVDFVLMCDTGYSSVEVGFLAAFIHDSVYKLVNGDAPYCLKSWLVDGL